MRTSTVSNGQATLAVTEWGDSGTPIVALHPGVGDSRIWGGCAPAWACAGHRVIAYDRRGFGGTHAGAEPHDDLADLHAVIAASVGGPAVIIGNSRGGGLALDHALAQPEDVSGLVLIAPSPSGYPDSEWPTSEAESELDRQIEAADASGDLELVNGLEARYWLDGAEQPEGRVEGPARARFLEMNLRALRAQPVGEAAERAPAWPRLRQITVPTLVVVGEHDLAGCTKTCHQLTDAMSNARLVTLPNTAHCPSLDQPDALNQVVLDFLREL